MMVEWRPKHVATNKWEKKDTLLVQMLLFSLTIYHNARYRTYKTVCYFSFFIIIYFFICRFKQLYVSNNSELDTCSYEPSPLPPPFPFQWTILSPSKIVIFPPESFCIYFLSCSGPYFWTAWDSLNQTVAGSKFWLTTYLMACHVSGLSPLPVDFGFVMGKVALREIFFSEYFSSPLSVSFHRCSAFIHPFVTNAIYKVVQIWPGQTVTRLHTISPGHIWTTL
jgi:hypothetical protein